jgi:hypothetical protein
MRLVVTIVAALMILGAVAAAGLILAQKGTPKGNILTETVASTVFTAAATQEVSAPIRARGNQIAQATGSEASPLILQANVDAQSDNPITTVTRAPSAAAAAPNVKDQSLSTISKAIVHETTRLKDDATGWAHKLQELELDLKLQLDLKKNQDLEATGRDIIECLVVLGAAASRLAPDAETGVTLRKQEVAVRDLAIRAEVHPDPNVRKTASYFQQKTTELRALNRSIEEIRTRLVTQIDQLEKLKIQLELNRTVAQIGEAIKGGEVSLDNIQAITEDAQRIAADLDGFGRAPAVVTEPAEATKPAEAANPVEVARPVGVEKRIPGTLMNARPHSMKEKRPGRP